MGFVTQYTSWNIVCIYLNTLEFNENFCINQFDEFLSKNINNIFFTLLIYYNYS
jgi:hypothetical protein